MIAGPFSWIPFLPSGLCLIEPLLNRKGLWTLCGRLRKDLPELGRKIGKSDTHPTLKFGIHNRYRRALPVGMEVALSDLLLDGRLIDAGEPSDLRNREPPAGSAHGRSARRISMATHRLVGGCAEAKAAIFQRWARSSLPR